jgi:hypothetical protein
MLLVPNIRRYMSRLEPFLEPPTGSGGSADEEKKTHAAKTLKYNEAVKVKDALRRAVGLCLKKLVADPRREAANAREPELRAARLKASEGSFELCTLVPIRPRPRGERLSRRRVARGPSLFYFVLSSLRHRRTAD